MTPEKKQFENITKKRNELYKQIEELDQEQRNKQPKKNRL